MTKAETGTGSISNKDARALANGLLPSGQNISSLSPTGREEVKHAIETVLRLYEMQDARLSLALEQLNRAADALAAKDAEIARLRKALKPFAEWHLAHIDYDDPNTELFDSDIVGIDVGDLRRARATLEGEGDG